MNKLYNPKEYWQERLSSQELTVATVGYSGLGLEYNTWLYWQRFHALERGIKKFGLNVNGKSVLDVGVGSGAYIPFWQKMNANGITGVDLTNASVNTLQQKFPHLRFFQLDITAEISSLNYQDFDIITCFDVLFHIIDDDAFSRAINNLSDLLIPGSILIISDGFCTDPWGPKFHEYHRSFKNYQSELNKNQLSVVHIEPIFFLMTTPLCGSKLLQRLIAIEIRVIRLFGKRKISSWINHLIGAALFGVDYIMGEISPTCPGLKFCFIQKTKI